MQGDSVAYSLGSQPQRPCPVLYYPCKGMCNLLSWLTNSETLAWVVISLIPWLEGALHHRQILGRGLEKFWAAYRNGKSSSSHATELVEIHLLLFSVAISVISQPLVKSFALENLVTSQFCFKPGATGTTALWLYCYGWCHTANQSSWVWTIGS